MAISDLHDQPNSLKTENRCALMFTLSLIGFVVAIGVASYLIGML